MGVLNFSEENLITGVNIIDGNLYWTDNLNEPKKLEIDRFRSYDHTTDSTNIRGDSFNEADVAVIKLHPFKPITLELEEYNPTPAEKLKQPDAPFEKIFPRFSYRWQYEDGQYSPYAPFTQPAFISKTRVLNGNPTWSSIESYAVGDIVNYDERAWVAALAVAAPTPPAFNAAPDTGSNAYWTEQGDAVYTSEEENYIQGYNTTLFNNVGKITLKDIPRGPRDAVAVDLLYKESISSTVYVLETIDIPIEHRGHDFIIGPLYASDTTGGRIPNTGEPRYPQDYTLLPLRYQLSARKIYSALPPNQLNRPYDEVPHRAKAQEITANRLIYGNYEIGFDQPESLQTTNSFVTAGSGDGLHVKGNRTYEIGVAYIDAYGRQGAMLQAGSITAPNGDVTEQIPLSSPFSQPSRQQIQVQINSTAPPWADRYRYFIKDPSADFHNLISYNIYNDGSTSENTSTYIWAEFLSTDRNKIQDGAILIPRKINDTIVQSKSRQLVQDIQNECPELIRSQLGLDGNLDGRVLGTVNHNRVELQSAQGNNHRNFRNGNYPNNHHTLFIRDETNDFNQTGVEQIINKYISKAGGVITEGALEIDKFDVDRNGSGTRILQEADLTTVDELSSSLYVRIGSENGGLPRSNWARVEVIRLYPDTGSDGHRTGFSFQLAENVLIENTLGAGNAVGIAEITPAVTGFNNLTGNVTDGEFQIEFASSSLSEEALERLQGRFWAKIPRAGLSTARSQFNNNGDLVSLHQVHFELEPEVDESNLDLFWETSDTFCVCTEHGCLNKLEWFNSVAEVAAGGVYLESTRINDQFNSIQLVKGVKVNVPTDRNSIIKRPYGLIWSGIYNGRTDTNRLNQFITADGITKELEPNYGSLQLLHTRDTNLIAACEDKIFRILADKDLLYNADGGGNVSASNRVLGQTTPFIGEYGISKNPESFASYGNNFWITDAARGVVLQVTPANGQINEVSSMGLKDHFRDRLHSATKLVGAYDDYSDSYMLSMQGYNQNDAMIDTEDAINGETSNITWRYEPARQGWSSRVSYIPEDGLSMNNKFYTYKGGKMFVHNSNNVPRNHFYNLPVKADPNPSKAGSFLPASYVSEIEVILNENPSALKDYLTLGYEGTPGWVAISIDTDSEDLTITNTWPFVKKEDKYFAPIVGQIPTYGLTNVGLGSAVADDGSTVFINGSQDKSGIKGFYNKVRLQNTLETKAELFAINSENKISSN